MTKLRERIVAPFLSEYSAHPRHVHISWPCSVAKSFGSICLHRKEQRAAENDFLARLQRFFTCPTTISRVTRSLVERRPRVIKDKTPKNTTWLVLDHHPLYRTGRVSTAIRKMFEYPFKALLDHAWGDTEHPCDKNLESQSHATCCDKVPEIHSHFVICCGNFVWGLCLARSGPFLVRRHTLFFQERSHSFEI